MKKLLAVVRTIALMSGFQVALANECTVTSYGKDGVTVKSRFTLPKERARKLYDAWAKINIVEMNSAGEKLVTNAPATAQHAAAYPQQHGEADFTLTQAKGANVVKRDRP